MVPYKNLSGNSGIIAYETGKTYIRIRFRDGTYTYNYSRPGRKSVEVLKLLASKGKGLSTYISRFIRDNYASRSDASE
jgi:hypothetical protein